MKGDFSRDSYDRFKHFRRVLMQQGRVQLDADWNEQVSILLHYIQTLAIDIIGPYAGPASKCGFGISVSERDISIDEGRYYVDGVLCENEKIIKYTEQLHCPNMPEEDGSYVVYLDVWERYITFLEDDDIREKALGGSDTATRTKTVWQVKMKHLEQNVPNCLDGAWLLKNEAVISKARLRARAKVDQEQWEPCLVVPGARYRGPENQLYRVEVHEGGSTTSQKPTFKWSRENGSIAFPIKEIKIDATTVTLELENLGRDDRFGLEVNDWVEIECDTYILNNEAKPLFQVQKVDHFELTVTLKKGTDVSYDIECGTHALLRRWDQKKGVTADGVLNIIESNDMDNGWLELEDGIKIQFQKDGTVRDGTVTYRTGDYWLIPARTALGDVEWPEDDKTSEPKYLPPRGVLHHLAPLAIISVTGKKVNFQSDCRCMFKPLSYDCSYSYYGQLGIGIGVDMLCPE